MMFYCPLVDSVLNSLNDSCLPVGRHARFCSVMSSEESGPIEMVVLPSCFSRVKLQTLFKLFQERERASLELANVSEVFKCEHISSTSLTIRRFPLETQHTQ